MSKNKLAVIAIVLMITLAGCVGPVDDPTGLIDGDSEEFDVEGEEPVDAVPQETNVLLQADPIGLLEDPTTEQIGDHIIQTFDEETDEFDSYDEALDDTFDEANEDIEEALEDEDLDLELEIEDLGEVVMFASIDEDLTELGESQVTGAPDGGDDFELEEDDLYFGTVIELDLNEEDLDELFNTVENEFNEELEDLEEDEEIDNVEITKETYEGFPIYTLTVEIDTEETEEPVDVEEIGVSLALIDDGLHVAGTTNAVEDAIDTYRGELDGVDDELLADPDTNTYFNFAAGDLGVEIPGVSEQLEDLDEDPTLDSARVSYGTDGDEVMTTSTEVGLESFESASAIEGEVSEALDEFRTQIDEAQEQSENGEDADQPPATGSELALIAPLIDEDRLTVSQEGTAITAEYETTVVEVTEFIDQIDDLEEGDADAFAQLLGFGATTDSDHHGPVVDEPQPQIVVEQDVDRENGQVTFEVLQNENVQVLTVRSAGVERGQQEIMLNSETGSETVDLVQSQGTIELIGYLEDGSTHVITEFDFEDVNVNDGQSEDMEEN